MSDLGLAIAASGIAADTAELDTASNNLSNIQTPGYAAEQVDLSPEKANGPLGAGQGVIVGSVTRLTSAVYAAANVAAEGISGAATQTSQIMSSIESIFPEPSSNGLASQLSALFSDLSSLAANPGQSGSEQAVVGAAQTVANSLNGSYSQLGQLASSLQQEIGTGSDGGDLAQVNSLLSQVAQLNQAIVAGSAGGQDANALADQSSADVNQLATLLGVSSSTAEDGSVTVYLNGVQLVTGDVAATLTATGSATTNNLALTTSDGVTVGAGGSMGANLTAIDTTIPDYQSQLSSVADSLATSLNSLQANGLDSNGDPGSAIAGTWGGTILPNIFVNGGSSTAYTTGSDSAATISVSQALVDDPSLLASAAAPGSGNSNAIGTGTLDGSNAQAMAAIASSGTGPETVYQSLIGAVGTQTSDAQNSATTASSLATTASTNLSSISGVDENTEEVDVLEAQNAFQASSQVINAVNESFQALLQAV